MIDYQPTVFIIDDNVKLCESLAYLISSIKIPVEVFHKPKDFLEKFDVNRQGCLLVDIRMPEMSGFELQDALNKRGNIMPVIFMTGHGDIAMAVRAMKAGAYHFIMKPFNDDMLLELIEEAIKMDKKQQGILPKKVYLERLQRLTARERAVHDGIVAGKLNKQIADTLNVSIKTIELDRSYVMQKMEIKSIAELVMLHMLWHYEDNNPQIIF